ncbi:hypothetical protein SAMN05444171_6943 [Bradyrhizobium lablabi]|uniref:Uncharacterized protein n=2 Tax=Bradyrhizobium TaxID=374 RepID=A0ABY0P703_9BRAD|nr:hypothetical protein SAMN05444163_0225 [Bradyrhizobium ottawaense]SEE29713.1 hypothetical protein SAMN05444171_6943 [Bradyrhizobium lablabi]SHM26065.1 hypothetical protein SAMN05444321_5750 [Bradyrhizobium lablabi]
MSVRSTIVLLSAVALPLFAVPSVANAQYTGALGRCVTQNPGPTGKACCLKSYTGYVSNSDTGRLAYEVQMCVDAGSKGGAKKK